MRRPSRKRGRAWREPTIRTGPRPSCGSLEDRRGFIFVLLSPPEAFRRSHSIARLVVRAGKRGSRAVPPRHAATRSWRAHSEAPCSSYQYPCRLYSRLAAAHAVHATHGPGG